MFSACIELLFEAEQPAIADRIRAAHAEGVDSVEFWTWRDKDLTGIAEALRETGVGVACLLFDPKTAIVDPANQEAFLEALSETSVVARELGAERLIVLTGQAHADLPRQTQHSAVVAALKAAAPLAHEAGLTLLLEPLNTVADHPGYFLDSTTEGLDIVEEVGHPAVRLLYDLYHSVMMQETVADELTGRGHLIGYVHIADAPGREEPGRGAIDWTARMAEIRRAGYGGMIGLEFRPSGSTVESLQMVRKHLLC